MAVKQTIWAADDLERRQLISDEVKQLRQMSESLRTRAMRSFMARLSAPRSGIKQTQARVKPSALAA